MARTETRFGAATNLSTTYTSLGTVPASTTWNVLLNVTNRTSSSLNLRAYVATSSWSTGEPTSAGSTLVAAIAYDSSVSPGQVVQFSGIVMAAGEKLVVYSSAAGLDVIASGVAIS